MNKEELNELFQLDLKGKDKLDMIFELQEKFD